MAKVYKNSTEVTQLHGASFYMQDVVDACLRGRLNLFLQGDTGSGKTQLAADAMNDFGSTIGGGKLARDMQEKYSNKLTDKSNVAIDAMKSFSDNKTLFVLGRNDMDTRELFQRINLGKLNQKPTYNLEPLVNPETGETEFYYPKVNEKGIFVYQKLSKEQTDIVRKGLEKLAGTSEDVKELTSKINKSLIVVDELPNCVPAVRAQLFNLFDGCIEIGGELYSIGNGYSVGIATGNIGQKFTESANELGRALKDRMHVVVDVDYFHPKSSDTLDILAQNRNPRVVFDTKTEDKTDKIIKAYESLKEQEVPLNKLIIANYLMHGLDYCSKGSKRKMKDAWPNQLENHEQGSDVGLVLPISTRAAKSIVMLSQALDQIAAEKGVSKDIIEKGYFDSMMQAFKLVSAYSGILNEAAVQNTYNNDKYAAIDAVIATTKSEFDAQADKVASGYEMVRKGATNKKILDAFNGRWNFMKDTLEGMIQKANTEKKE